MTARAIGAQMMEYKEGGKVFERIVLFEFECDDTDDDVLITKVAERHFALLPFTQITSADFVQAGLREPEDHKCLPS